MTGGQYAIQGGFWSLYLAIQTPGGPMLTIKRIGNNVEVSWPADSGGFVLQETASLNPAIDWLAVGTAPVVVEGRRVVTLPLQGGQHLFRLREATD